MLIPSLKAEILLEKVCIDLDNWWSVAKGVFTFHKGEYFMGSKHLNAY